MMQYIVIITIGMKICLSANIGNIILLITLAAMLSFYSFCFVLVCVFLCNFVFMCDVINCMCNIYIV